MADKKHLIYKEDLLDMFTTQAPSMSYNKMFMAVANAHTVDAVEVVRCKDCKHSIWDEEEQMWECVLTVDLDGDLDTYRMFHEYNDGEHFCSYGERKDNV